MEYDLSALPLWFAQPADFVLTGKIPSTKFIDSLKKLNFSPPGFIEKNSRIKVVSVDSNNIVVSTDETDKV